MLSGRTAWEPHADPLAARLEAARGAGGPLLDLVGASPALAGLGWRPGELSPLLADHRVASLELTPRGHPDARAAVASYLTARGAPGDPERVVLAASTGQAFSALLHLLCDPGDEVLVPSPSAPVLDPAADLAGVRLVRYPLRWDGEWHLDLAALAEAVGERTRAVVVASPASPTGALLNGGELRALDLLCAARGVALVGDEALADTALAPCPSVLSATESLSFHLAGLARTCGLPQLEAAWLAVGGPERQAAPALARLAGLAPVALSCSAVSQLALPRLLARREAFLGPLRARLAEARATLLEAPAGAALTPRPGRGGWLAVLAIGEAVDEEALCLTLLEEDEVAVLPGSALDFHDPGHLVVSLLTPPGILREGLHRLAARLALG